MPLPAAQGLRQARTFRSTQRQGCTTSKPACAKWTSEAYGRRSPSVVDQRILRPCVLQRQDARWVECIESGTMAGQEWHRHTEESCHGHHLSRDTEWPCASSTQGRPRRHVSEVAGGPCHRLATAVDRNHWVPSSKPASTRNGHLVHVASRAATSRPARPRPTRCDEFGSYPGRLRRWLCRATPKIPTLRSYERAASGGPDVAQVSTTSSTARDTASVGERPADISSAPLVRDRRPGDDDCAIASASRTSARGGLAAW